MNAVAAFWPAGPHRFAAGLLGALLFSFLLAPSLLIRGIAAILALILFSSLLGAGITAVAQVQLLFDQTLTGVVALDEIGLRRAGEKGSESIPNEPIGSLTNLCFYQSGPERLCYHPG